MFIDEHKNLENKKTNLPFAEKLRFLVRKVKGKEENYRKELNPTELKHEELHKKEPEHVDGILYNLFKSTSFLKINGF
jgi:hypothetical protein